MERAPTELDAIGNERAPSELDAIGNERPPTELDAIGNERPPTKLPPTERNERAPIELDAIGNERPPTELDAIGNERAPTKLPPTELDAIGNEPLRNILLRLDASSFYNAAFVCKSWNKLCSFPKLVSALSLNSSIAEAVEEVCIKVLSEPIRGPHFVIASIGGFREADAFTRIKKRLFGRKIDSYAPFIISTTGGIIGRDTRDKLRKLSGVKFRDFDNDRKIYGIVLTVGFVPGLKVAIHQYFKEVTLDLFVKNVQEYTSSVSGGCASPVGIVIFGEQHRINTIDTINELRKAMPKETVIVGEEVGRYSWSVESSSRKERNPSDTAVALVFARDKDKSSGEYQFRVAASNVASAVGPMYEAIEVDMDDHTARLTVGREEKREAGEARGAREALNVERILKDVNDELKKHIESSDLSIGVTEVRKALTFVKEYHTEYWPDVVKTLAFHGVRSGDGKYLFVNGRIKKGDHFQFFHQNPNASVSSSIESLKLHKNKVFGGFILSCYGCEESVFASNGDCLPVMEEFPEVPWAGMFCGVPLLGDVIPWPEGYSLPPEPHGIYPKPVKCCQHLRGSIYLVMAYTPAV